MENFCAAAVSNLYFLLMVLIAQASSSLWLYASCKMHTGVDGSWSWVYIDYDSASSSYWLPYDAHFLSVSTHSAGPFCVCL